MVFGFGMGSALHPILKGNLPSLLFSRFTAEDGTRQDSRYESKWIFSSYWKNGRFSDSSTDSTRTHHSRLYSDGRFYDVLADVLEQSPIIGCS
jgi:hypothetical protein